MSLNDAKPSDPIPDWIVTAAQDARQLLGLDDGWHISIKMVDHPSGKPEFNGVAFVDTAYLSVRMELARDLKPDAEGHRVIMHEMMHVALAGIFQAASYGFNQLPKRARKVAMKVYNDAEEMAIQRMTRAMQRAIVPKQNE